MSTDNESVDNDADLRAQLEALKTKNKELIAEKQAAKRAAEAAKEAAEEAASEAALKSGDVEAIKAAHTKELKKLQDQLAQRDTELRTIKVDNAITSELARSNINSIHSPLLETYLRAQVKWENGEASIQGKSIADYTKEFLSSEQGAHYVRPADNNGGGAVGSKAKAAALPTTWNLTKYLQMKSDAPEMAAVYAKEHNQTHLLRTE